MTPDEIAGTTDTQDLWRALRDAEAEGDDKKARLLRHRLSELIPGQQRRSGRRSAADDTVMAGTPYQDNQVTWREVLGILGVLILLGAVAFFVIPRSPGVIAREDIVASGGQWPFTVDEVKVNCADEGPIYRLSNGTTTATFTGIHLALSSEFTVNDEGTSTASVTAIRNAAVELCAGR